MVIKSINYQRTFNLGNFQSERIGVEFDLDATDNITEALNTAKALVETYHKENNKTLWDNTEGMMGTVTNSTENNEDDKAYDELVSHLSTIEYREDAHAYLENTPFKFTIAAKNIVQSKPFKH